MRLQGIAAIAEQLDLPQHVLRFWEKEFGHLRPMRRNRRRYYRAEDVEILQGVRTLLHDRGLTLDGLRRVFQERGPTFVRAVGRGEIASDPLDMVAMGLALAQLPPDRQHALIEALADPATCRALADQCLGQTHRAEAAHARSA
ncbi:hypothetical protein GOFOIKOB_2998 [Methylobacterium tardum]|uniref:HTH merR-type domain-containing protein n=1 Tax=Methylobacterium tardum TaxID=374432 RepID=A0AA37TFV2_9HYPH|nr:MerR family transcriptional regulator [Methylobacterium tardum]URD38343.1 MerR family transcriptional regulator [Methylobacterium tardum]GJE49957.1 hypothetical protein GOFOIKOB_2998 [Methylobacterium tardum]GLS70163.1 hypothetical protein GCM10007890_21760 [Methylobacterium tardum]